MNEAQVMKEFRKHKKQIITLLGREALVGATLNSVARDLFGSKFRGVYAQNENTYKNGYYIINTDLAGKAGLHWVALYITPKTVYVFDSFGRKSANLLPHVVAAHKHKRVIDTDHDRDQSDSSSMCGQLCLAWLMVVKSLGVRAALLV